MIEPIAFNNASDNKFTDISSELFRTYEFPERDVTISLPQYLAITAGGHRLFDAEGISHYIPKGWLHLYWKAKEGQPHFVK